MKGKKVILLVLIICVLALLAFFLREEEEVPAAIETKPISAQIVEIQAEEIKLLLQRENGLAVYLAEFRGQKIILNLWASWCTPCLTELPELDELQEKYAEQIKIIPLNIENDANSGKQAFRQLGLKNLEYFFDVKQTASSNLQIRGLPTSFILDENLKGKYQISGYLDWSSLAAEELLK